MEVIKAASRRQPCGRSPEQSQFAHLQHSGADRKARRVWDWRTPRCYNRNQRDKVMYPLRRNFSNPGLWLCLAGIVLILDVMFNSHVLNVGMRLASWFEPKGVVRHIELYGGIVGVFAGVWLYSITPKSETTDE
jgi:hypothetical protein